METAEQIIEFVSSHMRMSHVYQPLLIRALVRTKASFTLTRYPHVLRRSGDDRVRGALAEFALSPEEEDEQK
jgi:hypothetical protein